MISQSVSLWSLRPLPRARVPPRTSGVTTICRFGSCYSGLEADNDPSLCCHVSKQQTANDDDRTTMGCCASKDADAADESRKELDEEVMITRLPAYIGSSPDMDRSATAGRSPQDQCLSADSLSPLDFELAPQLVEGAVYSWCGATARRTGLLGR